MNKKSLLKKTLIGVCIVFLLAVGLIGFQAYRILAKLPSPGQIKSMVSKEEKKAKDTKSVDPVVEEREVAKEEPTANEQDALAKEKADRIMNKIAEKTIFDSESPVVNVCDNLIYAKDSKVELDPKDIFNTVGEALEKGDNDPLAESVLATLRYATRYPKAKEFFAEIQNSDSAEEHSMAKKAWFYAHAYQAYQEMQSHKQNINDFSTRTYHLFVLAKVVRENDQLANNPKLQEYCQRIQKSMNEDVPYHAEVEVAEMEKFLAWANVPPEKINFDAKMKSEVKLEITANQFSIGFGWLDNPSPAKKAD